MNGFNLSTISSVYVGSTLYSSIYKGSTLIWPTGSTQLPYDAEIEYLLPNSNAYIDYAISMTKALLNEASYIEYTTECVILSSNGAEGSNESYFFVGVNRGNFYSGLGGNYNLSSTANDQLKHTIKLIKQNGTVTLYLDDVSINTYNYANSRNNLTHFLLFNIYNHSSVLKSQKKYYAKLLIDNNVIFEMIPVRVGSIGYMYDKISGLLYGSANSDYFILGPDKLPTGYTKLEYISSTNNGNQYIDVGMRLYEVLNTDYDIAMKFSISSTNAESQATMFNCLDPNNNPWPGTFIRRSSSNVVGRYIGGSAKDNTIGKTGDVIELPVQTSPNKNVTNINNNNSTHLYGVSLFSSFSDTNNTPQRCCNGTLYYFKLFVNDTLVRDMIPCKNSNNVVGMYDIVNDVFYTSPNGAAFVAGPEV